MTIIGLSTLILALSLTLTKGQYMEGRIDKIDVTREHQELIALFYRIELRTMLQRILYEHYARAGITNQHGK